MKHQSKQKQVKKALAATKKNPGMVKAAKEKQCAIQCPICRVRAVLTLTFLTSNF